MKLTTLLAALLFTVNAYADLTVLTDRPKDRLAAAVQEFTAKTGVNVTLVEAGYPDLLKKLEEKSPADVIITKDLVYLAELDTKKLLAPLTASAPVQKVRSFMRGSAQNWVALSYRVRTAAYDPSRVQASELTTYEDLSTPKWQGRLCLRTGKGSYNEALVAYLVQTHGVKKAEAIVRGWVANLAAPVFPNDTAMLEAVANGTCDVAITNHYYLAGLHAKNPNYPVKIAFLNQAQGGVHSNGAGMGIVTGSQQAALAQQLLDILLADKHQLEISATHFDYPATEHLKPTSLIQNWGVPKLDNSNWSDIGASIGEARRIIREAGYN